VNDTDFAVELAPEEIDRLSGDRRLQCYPVAEYHDQREIAWLRFYRWFADRMRPQDR